MLTTSLPPETAPETTFPTPLTIGFLNTVEILIKTKLVEKNVVIAIDEK